MRKLVSGGQTGVDRAALEAARELGLERGGFCPRRRRAEDGRIPDEYELAELETEDYAARTRANVEAGDATLVVRGAGWGKGTEGTVACARELGKPVLVIDTDGRGEPEVGEVEALRRWLEQCRPRVLNVGGSRASEDSAVGGYVKALLRQVLCP